MTPRERVQKAVSHRQPDRVPWDLHLTRPALEKVAVAYKNPRLKDPGYFDRWVGNHCVLAEPNAKGLFHGLEEQIKPGLWRDGWGVIWDTRGMYGEGEWGRPVNRILNEPTLAHYTFPAPPKPEAFTHYPRFIENNREFFIIALEGHLFEVAWALRGMEDFLIDMVENPDFVDNLLDGITEYYLAVIDESVKYDIDAFTFGEDWGSQDKGLIMGPHYWRKYIKPRMARMFSQIRQAGKIVHLHSDGDISLIFEDLIEIGLDVYNPFQPEIMDVFEMKKKYGDRLCFHGGVGVQSVLPYGTPDDVRKNVQRLLKAVGDGGGYILAQAHPDGILGDAPVENIIALIETVRKQ
jgi:uroporphyrinogen decarboxylase